MELFRNLEKIGKYNQSKFLEVKDNQNFTKELKIVEKMPKGFEYYKKIIKNVEVDKSNKNNSYILWIFNKVDNLDKNRPVRYNEGKSSLPDIDIDIPKHSRDATLEYIRNKYGKTKVGQIATFGTMQGRGALKDVMRAYGISFDEVNKITKLLPEPAKIAGELEEIKQEEGSASIIKYALENDPKKFEEWVFYNNDGVLEGIYAEQFQNAMRAEGIITSQGKHACGIVVGQEDLSNVCPMVYDSKTKTQICGLSLDDAESVGLMKLDALGLSTLDKLMGIQKILSMGSI